MQKVNIQTTQNVLITYEVAGVGDRIIAWLIDFLIIIAYSIFVSIFIFDTIRLTSEWLSILFFLPAVFYHFLCELFLDGQSPGKKARDIKVVKKDGSEPGVGSYFLRWLFRLVETNPILLYGMIAILAIILGGKGQRIGDMAAGTVVVSLRKKEHKSKQKVIQSLEESAYVPVFLEARYLTDRDVQIILEALTVFRTTANKEPVLLLEKKLKDLLSIQSDLAPVQFLNTLVKDFNHFATHG